MTVLFREKKMGGQKIKVGCQFVRTLCLQGSEVCFDERGNEGTSNTQPICKPTKAAVLPSPVLSFSRYGRHVSHNLSTLGETGPEDSLDNNFPRILDLTHSKVSKLLD
ncbi:unnamed protein product [Ceratitis capitata]|uniref:(Mediterranean fruit fly) hypothetical protein n=1 Tax=Ceratitis capitata TaxID=7213 RepID=A0A811UKR1_CERCA|nr:unnamed protein product [Ceratitis capitata]